MSSSCSRANYLAFSAMVLVYCISIQYLGSGFQGHLSRFSYPELVVQDSYPESVVQVQLSRVSCLGSVVQDQLSRVSCSGSVVQGQLS